MLGKSHGILGIDVGLGSGMALQLSPPHLAMWTGVVAVASMLPDIDTRKAYIVKYTSIVGVALCHIIRYVSLLLTGRSHRGLTHTLAFTLAVSAPFLLVANPLGLLLAAAIAIGLTTHIILGDGGTVSGVPWLWYGGRSPKMLHTVPKPLRFHVGYRTKAGNLAPEAYILAFLGIVLVALLAFYGYSVLV